MRITRLSLADFRNFERATLAPCAGVSVLFGDNAQGKTNALEAVVLCCTGRSHRTPRDREMIRSGQSFGRVELTCERADGEHEIAMLLRQSERKRISVNGSALARSGELMGHLTGVLFAPEDLRLVKDGPAERRRFMDMELSQMYPAYYYALQRYNRALLQRNKLLHDAAVRGALSDTVSAWEDQLAISGAQIVERRRAFLTRLAKTAKLCHAEISGGAESLEVGYKPAPEREETGAALENALRGALEAARSADLHRQSTSVGPHRDDVSLTLNGQDARAYASQGQQRTIVLSLKLSELEVMRETTGEYPVLLLDDVMSELDPGRRRQLLRKLHGVQTIVTCTDPSDLAGAEIGMACRVHAGTLEDVDPSGWRDAP